MAGFEVEPAAAAAGATLGFRRGRRAGAEAGFGGDGAGDALSDGGAGTETGTTKDEAGDESGGGLPLPPGTGLIAVALMGRGSWRGLVRRVGEGLALLRAFAAVCPMEKKRQRSLSREDSC